jgi:hypothetical protein
MGGILCGSYQYFQSDATLHPPCVTDQCDEILYECETTFRQPSFVTRVMSCTVLVEQPLPYEARLLLGDKK